MKKLKKIAVVFLALCLTVGIFAIPTLAVETGEGLAEEQVAVDETELPDSAFVVETEPESSINEEAEDALVDDQSTELLQGELVEVADVEKEEPAQPATFSTEEEFALPVHYTEELVAPIAWQIRDTEEALISLDVLTNYTELMKIYNGNPLEELVLKSGTFVGMEIPGEITCEESDILVSMPIYAATSTGKMSTDYVQNNPEWNSRPLTDFPKIEPLPGESVKDFRSRVRRKTAPGTYGIIWDEAENRTEICMNIGVLPDNMSSLKSKEEIFAFIDGDASLSDVRKQHTKDAYERVFTASNGAGAIGAVFQFKNMPVEFEKSYTANLVATSVACQRR